MNPFKKQTKQIVEDTETQEPLDLKDEITLLELTDEKRDELAVALYHISHSLYMNVEELDKIIEFLGIDIKNASYMRPLLGIDIQQWIFQQKNFRKK